MAEWWGKSPMCGTRAQVWKCMQTFKEEGETAGFHEENWRKTFINVDEVITGYCTDPILAKNAPWR